MQRISVLLLISLLFVGIFATGFVLADDINDTDDDLDSDDDSGDEDDYDDEERIKRKVKIKVRDGNEIEIESRLKIREHTEGNVSVIKVKRRDGNDTILKILPSRASEIARERLRARNISLEIREIEHKNIPRVVYHVSADRPGKFLGIFKIRAKYETQIDTETGEVLKFKGPWWAFLITAQEDLEIVINETDSASLINNPVINETNITA